MTGKTDAWSELKENLQKGEIVEGIIFGEWGWNGYKEPIPNLVPHKLFGKILSLKQAKKYMKGWSFYSGYGSPECYAINIYTNKRVIWVTQYDGATCLSSMPRNPTEGEMPIIPGG